MRHQHKKVGAAEYIGDLCSLQAILLVQYVHLLKYCVETRLYDLVGMDWMVLFGGIWEESRYKFVLQ